MLPIPEQSIPEPARRDGSSTRPGSALDEWKVPVNHLHLPLPDVRKRRFIMAPAPRAVNGKGGSGGIGREGEGREGGDRTAEYAGKTKPEPPPKAAAPDRGEPGPLRGLNLNGSGCKGRWAGVSGCRRTGSRKPMILKVSVTARDNSFLLSRLPVGKRPCPRMPQMGAGCRAGSVSIRR